MSQGRFDLNFEYVHERADEAFKGSGEPAANSKHEVVEFKTLYVGARYGVTDRINLAITLPLMDLYAEKDNKLTTGTPSVEDYTRVATGIGDLIVTADYSFGTSPQVSVEFGVKAPTGSVDKKDEFGQPLDSILQLGSGTTDFILGAGFWIPHVFLEGMDLVGGIRHRIVPGRNKWGYDFGDQTSLTLHASKPWGAYRLGLRLTGLHMEQDQWHGYDHAERGATILAAGPTLSYQISELSSLGVNVESPLYLHLTGSQLVDTAIVRVTFNTNLSDLFGTMFSSEEDLQ